MTKLINFIPNNPFDHMLQNIIRIEDCESNIESIYTQAYNENDDHTQKFYYINNIVNNILKSYNEDPSKLIHFKNDIDVIFVFSKIAIKIYKSHNILNNKQDYLYAMLSKNNCPNLEHIYESFFINDLFIVISKVVDTHNYKSNIDSLNIRLDIINALEYLLQNGWNHRDVSLDNIGYDTETNNYILFDFGISKINYSNNINDDLNSLNKSIKFHTK